MTAPIVALSPSPLSPSGAKRPAGSSAGSTAGGLDAPGAAGMTGAAGLLISALAIPGRPEHVHAARAFVNLILGVHHRDDEGVASLLVSELVTNSLRHGDSGATDGTIENGRGLHLVAELSDSWGYVATSGRLTTWFELTTNGGIPGE
jgi:hypothetical protein